MPNKINGVILTVRAITTNAIVIIISCLVILKTAMMRTTTVKMLVLMVMALVMVMVLVMNEKMLTNVECFVFFFPPAVSHKSISSQVACQQHITNHGFH